MTRPLAAIASGLSLLACLLAPVLHFQGVIGESAYKQIFAIASLGWFVAATIWATRRKA